jgi:hypothetical protein
MLGLFYVTALLVKGFRLLVHKFYDLYQRKMFFG